MKHCQLRYKITNSIITVIKNHVIGELLIGEPESSTSKSIEESISKFNKEYNSFIKEFPESAQQWEAQIDGEIMLQTPDILSISFSSYMNTGGAHGNLNITFLNFDSLTGNHINNDALFNNIECVKAVAEQYCKVEIEEKESLFDADSFSLPANIGYSEEGVILLYNTYEIAPYSTGFIEFSIPFNEVNDFLVFNSL